MKIFSLIAILLIAASCSQQKVADYIVFSGKIENPFNDKISIKGSDSTYVMKLDSDGSFSDTVRGNSCYFTFYDGRESTAMYLENGSSVSITLNTEEFDETVKYTGKGSEASNYLAEKYMMDENSSMDAASLYSLPEDKYLDKINGISNSFSHLMDDYENLPKKFIENEKKNLEYGHLNRLAGYENAHRHFTKDFEFSVSDEFLAPLKDLDYDNEQDFKKFSDYNSLVKTHYNGLMSGENGVETFFNTLENLKSPSIREHLSFNASYEIRPNNPDYKIIYENLVRLSTDKEFNTRMEDKFNRVEKLKKGMASPLFAYNDVKGKRVKLEDLAGKYIYVDVWATWCSPCIAEIPHLKKLEHEMQGQNVEFVSISIDRDDDFDKWKSMVREKELTGIQLMADNDWESDFAVQYVIESIPRFIIIDPEGNIVNADAPRPSDPDLKVTLNGLIAGI